MATPSRRLVTIPFSHYCEKARWALDRAGLTYEEEGHLPFLHVLPARRAGGTRQVPVLATPHGPVEDSTRILRWVDALLPEERRLFPHEPSLRAEVERWESRFDDELGPHARRWAYGHLLPDRERAVALMRRNVPSWEHAALRRAFPAAAALLRRALRVTPDGVARSRAKVTTLFEEVGAALADGRRYLTGDRFTAADLAFAALATPAVFPARCERWLGTRDELPPSILPEVDALRATPAGRFAERLYAEDR